MAQPSGVHESGGTPDCVSLGRRLTALDIDGGRSFVGWLGVVGDLCALDERAVGLAGDTGITNEAIVRLGVFGRDEAGHRRGAAHPPQEGLGAHLARDAALLCRINVVVYITTSSSMKLLCRRGPSGGCGRKAGRRRRHAARSSRMPMRCGCEPVPWSVPPMRLCPPRGYQPRGQNIPTRSREGGPVLLISRAGCQPP